MSAVSPASDRVHQAASDSVISCGPDGHARDDALMDIDPQYPVVSDEARAVYGSIGPAFYGLRTTLVVFVLLTLAAERPAHPRRKRQGPV